RANVERTGSPFSIHADGKGEKRFEFSSGKGSKFRLNASQRCDVLANGEAVRGGNPERLEPGSDELARRVARAHQTASLMSAGVKKVMTELVRGYPADRARDQPVSKVACDRFDLTAHPDGAEDCFRDRGQRHEQHRGRLSGFGADHPGKDRFRSLRTAGRRREDSHRDHGFVRPWRLAVSPG